MDYYILDRIENEYAVLQDVRFNIINIPLKYLKGEIKEGNAYSKDKEYYIFDEKYTKQRKDNINNITKNMWE